MDQPISFGDWVRRRRRALDLTQDALAQLVGYALATIKKIEIDERRPSREMAEQLADCLRIPADQRDNFLRAARNIQAVDNLADPTTLLSAPTPASPTPFAAASGALTFLFTDIAGSTRLWEQYPQAMPAALARHDALLRQAITAQRACLQGRRRCLLCDVCRPAGGAARRAGGATGARRPAVGRDRADPGADGTPQRRG